MEAFQQKIFEAKTNESVNALKKDKRLYNWFDRTPKMFKQYLLLEGRKNELK